MNRPDGALTAWPEKAAIALICGPVALFFGTWFHPLVGLPAAALAAWIGWKVARATTPLPMPPRGALAILALVAVLWTGSAGIGGFYDQAWDHNFRNALLHDLIDNSWPVAWGTPDGVVALDYYLAWSLAPALVGKLLGWRAATLAMAAVCAFGLFLVLLVFARTVGTWRRWLPLVFVLWSGLDVVGWILHKQIPGFHVCIEAWSDPVFYVSHLLNYDNASHQMIPAWLITLLLIGRRVDRRVLVGLAAFLIPLAPFQAVGIAPFVVWALLQEEGSFIQRLRGALTLENFLPPLAFAALCAPFFLHNQGAGVASGWLLGPTALPTQTPPITFVAFWLLEILIPAAAIWFAGRRDSLFLLAVVVLCLIPLRRAGLTNDLALKMSVPGLMVLTYFTARALVSNLQGIRRWFLVGVFLLGTATPFHHLIVSTYFTVRSPSTLEKDYIGTFDPAHPLSGEHCWLEKYRVNFRSHPLGESSLLLRLLGVQAHTAQARGISNSEN